MLNIKKDLVLFVVASIILALVIPSGGLLRDYTTEYCNKDFVGFEIDSFSSDLDYPFYLKKDVGFFSCEIGYIEGYAELEYLLNFPTPFEKEVFILDYSNYINYLNGEVFGVNTFNLIVDKNNLMQDYGEKETYFSPSNYFFVIDWDYRTSYESEDVERPYFLDHNTPEDICPTGLDENYTWENSNCIMFNYYLNIDYITSPSHTGADDFGFAYNE
tara:strand:- start:53 stop:700 length:648 start_codon:yes stop_codon:yes gene_type:complete